MFTGGNSTVSWANDDLVMDGKLAPGHRPDFAWPSPTNTLPEQPRRLPGGQTSKNRHRDTPARQTESQA